jgi:hypothetical protein
MVTSVKLSQVQRLEAGLADDLSDNNSQHNLACFKIMPPKLCATNTIGLLW